MKYRKKPVVIDAVQYTNYEDNADYVLQWSRGFGWNDGNDLYVVYESNGPVLFIRTLEGDMLCSPGDYIIRGVNGEFYPCKEDIFHKTYEAVYETDS